MSSSKSNGAPCVLLLLLTITYASSAQPDSNPSDSSYPYRNINASMMILVVIFIVVFLLIALMSVFIRHCADNSEEWSSNSMFHRPYTSTGARFWKLNHRRGLDTSLVESFPTFNSFSEIKDGSIAAAIECAVCLNELDDDDGKILRLLPKCGHVYHRDCIDNWIASHNTCPVCRTDLSKNSTTASATAAAREHLLVVESRSTTATATATDHMNVGERETGGNQISITISNVVVHNNTFPSENLNLRRSRSTGDLTSKVKRVNSWSDDEGSSERGNWGGGEQGRSKVDGDARPLTGIPV